jgi:hypothetical protein
MLMLAAAVVANYRYPKTIGEKVYHPKQYPAFVQVGAEVHANGQLAKSAKTGYSILDDGCCNTCTGNDLEPPEQRYSEPHGGPFGLLPRLEGIHVRACCCCCCCCHCCLCISSYARVACT